MSDRRQDLRRSGTAASRPASIRGRFSVWSDVARGVAVIGLVGAAPLPAQQASDTGYRAPIERPRFDPGTGPVIAIDAGHHNFHTAEGRFRPFARLMADDGYQVRSLDGPLTARSLRGVKVLVIANALAEANLEKWSLPTPSPFTEAEIAAVALAGAFGVTLANGVVFDSAPGRNVPAFTRQAGTLRSHPITDGPSLAERIDSVRSFTGEGFRVPAGFAALMVFGPGAMNYLPTEAWKFDSTTTRESAEGLAQAAGGRPMGMNHPMAPQNWRFVRQAIRWLTP